MVIQDATSLFQLINSFEPNNIAHLNAIKELLQKYPNFHLARAYQLKAIKQLEPSDFNQALSHTAISTFDRELLYKFIEQKHRKAILEEDIPLIDNEIQSSSPVEKKENTLKQLSFSEWAYYIKNNKQSNKKDIKLIEKFALIDSFLVKNNKMVPNKNVENKVDLSEKSWASSDELMTETLAKVFTKQKKYNKALQAYQILGLKYPEKNSFFADQIKMIKKLQKLKD
jgi:hypothetical protein